MEAVFGSAASEVVVSFSSSHLVRLEGGSDIEIEALFRSTHPVPVRSLEIKKAFSVCHDLSLITLLPNE